MVFIILLLVFSPDTFRWLNKALKPLIYAFIIAYLLDSVVKFLVRKLKIRRCQGILLACILLIGIFVLIMSIAVPMLVENLNSIYSFLTSDNFNIMEFVTSVREKMNNGYIDYITDMLMQTSESLQDRINNIILESSNVLMQMIANIGTSTLTIITSFIISIYMLIEKDDLLARGKRLIVAFFERSTANKILETFRNGNKIFKSFLNGKILDSAVVGIICIILFSLFKIRYALLLGTLIGIFNIIPYFGPIIGMVPVVIVTFLDEPSKALTVLIIIVVVQQLDANFLDPKIVGDNVGVSPFWILTAVIIGGNIAGISGMIFGVPILVLIKTIIEESIEMRLVDKGISDYQKEMLRTPKDRRRLKK